MPTAFAVFPHGVIGNTTVFGTVILGSSPGGEAFLVFLPAASKAFELGFLRNRSHLGRGVINGGYTSAGQHPAAPIRQDGHAASDDGGNDHAEGKLPVVGEGHHNDAGQDGRHGIKRAAAEDRGDLPRSYVANHSAAHRGKHAKENAGNKWHAVRECFDATGSGPHAEDDGIAMFAELSLIHI